MTTAKIDPRTDAKTDAKIGIKTSRRKTGYYAVYLPQNNIRTVVQNWEQCEPLVRGQSHAQYKKFSSRQAADEYLKAIPQPNIASSKTNVPSSKTNIASSRIIETPSTKLTKLKLAPNRTSKRLPKQPSKHPPKLLSPTSIATQPTPTHPNAIYPNAIQPTPTHATTIHSTPTLFPIATSQNHPKTPKRPSSKQKQSPYYAAYLPDEKSSHIVETWAQCEKLIKNIPNARYKKLHSYKEAQAYLKHLLAPVAENDLAPYVPKVFTPKTLPATITLSAEHEWTMYTDGSSIQGIPYIAWGWSLVRDDSTLLGERVGFKPISESSNIEAELIAALNAAQTIKKLLDAPVHSSHRLAISAHLRPLSDSRPTQNSSQNPLKPHPKDLFKDSPKDLSKDSLKDLSKDSLKDLSKDSLKDLSKDSLRDLSKDSSQKLPRDSSLKPHTLPPTQSSPHQDQAIAIAPYVTISYDYLGVEKWATHEWKAKTPLTYRYQEAIKPFLKYIRFKKIQAHGANVWNDRIDKLVRFQLEKRYGTP